MLKKVMVAAALIFASGFASANLIQNGSFEHPTQADGTWTVYPSTYPFPNWSSSAGVELRNNVVGTASDGKNFVELDAHSNSSIWQTVSTVQGQQYKLTFDYSPRISQPASTNGISVEWNGAQLNSIALAGGSANMWQTITLWVIGTGSDTLKFIAGGTSDSLGGNIDNVQLNAVPLPAAAWLFGSAILGFMGFSTRRRV